MAKISKALIPIFFHGNDCVIGWYDGFGKRLESRARLTRTSPQGESYKCIVYDFIEYKHILDNQRTKRHKTATNHSSHDQARQQQIRALIQSREFVYVKPWAQKPQPLTMLSKPSLTIIAGGVFGAETTSTPESILSEIDEEAGSSTPESVWAETAKSRGEQGARYVPTSIKGVVRILSVRPMPRHLRQHKAPEQ